MAQQQVDLKQLQAAGFSAGPKGEDAAAQEERRNTAEEQRRMMLTSLLLPDARERLSRVAIVKPENARAVENHLISLARSGKLREQVGENTIIKLLEELSGGGAGGGVVARKVTITRKRQEDDSDDNDDDL